MLVGIFATPDHDRPLDLAAFRTALDGFSRCLRSEGLTRFPLPQVGENDPYRALEGLPIDWDDDSFVERAAACVDHLEEYVFAGPGGP
jgi:hypothetical protein